MESYHFRTIEAAPEAPLLFVFHGTGGDENQFLGLARDLLPEATVIAPRGDVSENGAARFFRRTGEGVYDMDDLARATAKMTAFVRGQAAERRPSSVLALGYSNGANILASMLFAAPDLFEAAVLMHPLIPFEPTVEGDLSATRILITGGRNDPICPPHLTSRLEAHLRHLQAQVELLWHEGGHEVRQAEIAAIGDFFASYRKEDQS